MATKVSVNTLYVYDERAGRPFSGITVIKLVNDKIEEIHFKVETRFYINYKIIKKIGIIYYLFFVLYNIKNP